MRRKLTTAACIAALLTSAPALAQTATYRVTFDATWSAATHPGAFPSGAHFSSPIGGTHNNLVEFWAPGGIASPGMESMAEVGGTATLTSEINAAITAGNAGDVITAPGLPTVPAVRNTTFGLTSTHPQVTLVTMIAPSPDWFVGVHGLVLHDGGKWFDNVVVALDPYDAGTDSGLTFSAPNADTNPQEPIRNLSSEAPFAGTPPLGTFTFRILNLPCRGDVDGDNVATLTDLAIMLSNFGMDSGALAGDGDVNNDRAVDLTDLAELLSAFEEPCVVE